MTHTIKDLARWPRMDTGQPILNSTNEAFLYAQLIHDDHDKQQNLLYYRNETYAQLKSERDKKHPDLQYMMDMAVRAQFLREAYTEARRIRDEKIHLQGG